MSWHQALVGTLISLCLIGLGGWFLFPFKIPFSISKSLRILYGFHLLVMGLMLAYAQLFLENQAQTLADLSDAAASRGEVAPYSKEDLVFAAGWGIFWFCFSLVFVTFIMIAFWDSLRRAKNNILKKENGKSKRVSL